MSDGETDEQMWRRRARLFKRDDLLHQMAWTISHHWKDGPRCHCGRQDREYTEHVAEMLIREHHLTGGNR